MSEKETNFDIAVLGGGPGGYPAAIRAAQLGKKVALIEAKELGGTCLNRGCIPSKTLIANAEVLQKVKEAEEFGVVVGGEITFDYAKMVDRKNAVVAKVRKGLEGLIASNKITLFKGMGKLTGPKEIKITGADNALIRADKIIIATGSEPRNIPAFPFDWVKIHDSTSLLDMKTLPKSLIIVGGGIIGCEFASLYNILGVDVTILELLPRILPMESTGVSNALAKIFQRKGIKMITNALVEKVETTPKGVKAILPGGKVLEADIALIAVGRSMNTNGIGLEKAGIVPNQNGSITVNGHMQTDVPSIYAIGDIASKWWLAHVATHQGLVAANHACGHHGKMNYDAIPSVIFTDPEIGTVGLSLDQAIEKGYQAAIGAFPFQALGKSQATMNTEGFAQVVIDIKTGQILGAQIVGHEASSLIAEMTMAIANELTVESITETIHAHPTIPEAWLEAALLVNGTPLHFPPQKKG